MFLCLVFEEVSLIFFFLFPNGSPHFVINSGADLIYESLIVCNSARITIQKTICREARIAPRNDIRRE